MQDRLYPFILKLQEETGEQYWLIEDNAKAHLKALRIGPHLERSNNVPVAEVKRAPHPPDSPDFNMIEKAWHYIKDKLDENHSELKTCGNSQEAVELAKRAIQEEWDALPQEKIDHWCDSFHENLRKSQARGGNNDFNG